MPYIKFIERREYCARQIAAFNTSGQLNFALTDLIKFYIEDKGLTYQTINDIVGALDCCKQEFYRRIVIPYEDKKIQENGDVY